MATASRSGPAQPASERPRTPWGRALREVRVLRVTPQVVLPSACSCCGAPAAATRVERRADGESMIVPYCTDCHQHASAWGTRVLSVLLASSLAGASAAAAAPVVWHAIAPLPHAVLALACAGVPALLGLVRRGRLAPGHSARLRAVWWRRDELVATNARWARDLAESAAVQSRAAVLAEPYFSRWMLLGVVLSLLSVVAVRELLFASVRVLNLTDEPFVVFVDGRALARVEPTFAESPAAGVEIVLFSGTRRFHVLGEAGQRRGDAEVQVGPARAHLYAPASAGHCFWLETTTYGRSAREPAVVEPLTGTQAFWPIPPFVDGWFVPNPASASESRSTGGTLTALRQSSCESAPAAVRRAAGQ